MCASTAAPPDSADPRIARLQTLGDHYPFQSNFLEVAGGEMHYVDEGDGPPIVLLHGNPTWSFYYRHLIKGLRDHFRVIVPDHIGCGMSDKPQQFPYTLQTHIDNVSSLIEHLQLSDVMLGVHDWGGPIGFGWATQHPKRVRGLVVFNTAAFLGGRIPLRIRVCGWPIIGSLAVLHMNAFAGAAVSMACRQKERMTDDVKRGYLLPYDTPKNRIATYRFVRDIPTKPSDPSFSTLRSIEEALHLLIDHPMQIHWGMRDFCFTPKFRDEWRRRFPNAESFDYDDSGHYVIEDAHENILPRVHDFAKRCAKPNHNAVRCM